MAPRLPEIYVGENYFTIKFMIELYIPVHIPWIILPINNITTLGINKRPPVIKAIRLTRKTLFLN